MKWEDHINYLKKKIIPYVAALNRIRKNLPKQLLSNIYFAHIHSRLVYLNSIWSSASAYRLRELQILQNKAVKFVNNLPMLTPSSQLYNVKILPLDILKIFEMCVLCYKLIHKIIKSGLILSKVSETHQYNTRNRNNLTAQNFPMNAFLSTMIFHFNSLPLHVKNSNTILVFKNRLKVYLMAN